MKVLAPLCFLILVCAPAALTGTPPLLTAQQGRGASLREEQASEPTPGASRSEEARDLEEKEQSQLAAKAFKIADYDNNGWISFLEAKTCLEVDKPRFLVYDENRDGGVTVDEYVAISLGSWRRLGSFKMPLANPDDPRSAALLDDLFGGEATDDYEYIPAEADSVLELFGQAVPRVLRENSVPEPDQIIGPVPPYRRVNYDNEGGISAEDLRVLLRGSSLHERPNSLLAILDTDGDGEISEAEFMDSMRSKP
jgi:hypothetical protein